MCLESDLFEARSNGILVVERRCERSLGDEDLAGLSSALNVRASYGFLLAGRLVAVSATAVSCRRHTHFNPQVRPQTLDNTPQLGDSNTPSLARWKQPLRGATTMELLAVLLPCEYDITRYADCVHIASRALVPDTTGMCSSSRMTWDLTLSPVSLHGYRGVVGFYAGSPPSSRRADPPTPLQFNHDVSEY